VSDLDEAQREQLKFLLADFGAIKAEIARRSTLQRVVLVGYLAVVALVFQQTVFASLSRLWVFAIWAIAALAYQFYVREGLEVSRLGTIIEERIAKTASDITGVPPAKLLPSETDSELPNTLKLRRAYDWQFNWAVFFLVPLGVTVVFAVTQPQHLRPILDWFSRAFFTGLFTLAAAFRSAHLLKRHAWPSK